LQTAGLGKPEGRAVLEIGGLRGLEAVSAALAKVKGGEEAGEPLRTATEALTAMGLADFVQVDLTIVRGLAYYTGIGSSCSTAPRNCAPSAVAGAMTIS